VPLACGCQLAPPSVVAMRVPSSPTAQPRWPSAVKVMLSSQACVPLACGCQLAPPSVVAMRVPSSPTAQPRRASTKNTAVRSALALSTGGAGGASAGAPCAGCSALLEVGGEGDLPAGAVSSVTSES
jgi:hypothetical protein